MGKHNEDEEEMDTMLLTLEDDSEMECVVLAKFEADFNTYVALLPVADLETEEGGDVYLYRYVQGEGEEFTLENIESDTEFEIVQDAFDELLDEDEFNGME